MDVFDVAGVLLLVCAATFFCATAILMNREIKARKDFKTVVFGGSLNLYRYYRYVRRNGENLSTTLRLFLVAHVGLAAAMVVFGASFLLGSGSD